MGTLTKTQSLTYVVGTIDATGSFLVVFACVCEVLLGLFVWHFAYGFEIEEA